MATDVEKLIVSLEARTKEYEKALAKAQNVTVTRLRSMEKQAESFATRFDRKLGAIGATFRNFAAGFVGGLGIEQLARAAASAIKSIADIGDEAKKLGMSTSDFQELAAAAKYSGTDVSALASAMKKLAINSSEAAQGNGEFANLLRLNNVSIRDANGELKSQAEILAIVADLVKNAASEQDKLAIAQIALGKSGTEMMGLLADGADGVVAAMKYASEEGLKFTDEQIAKAQEFDDKIDLLVDKISVNLKGAFIEAAIGAESFASRASAALEQSGISISRWTDAMADALKYHPAFLSTTLAFGALQGEGQRLSADAPPPVGTTVSGPGKGSLPTVMPGASKVAQSASTYQRSEKAAKSYAKAVKEVEEAVESESDALGRQISLQDELNAVAMESIEAQRDAWLELAQSSFSALEGIVLNGDNAADSIKNLAKQMADAAVQAALFGQGPMAALFNTASSGGLFGSLLGGGVSAGIYHGGGIVGGGGQSRNISPAAFAGAPRYHSGGIAGLRPGEVPAILQRGEMVIPRSGINRGDGIPAPIINVHNGSSVETSTRSNGQHVIDIGKMINQHIAGGRANTALAAQFGLRPQGKRR